MPIALPVTSNPSGGYLRPALLPATSSDPVTYHRHATRADTSHPCTPPETRPASRTDTL